jgi:PAS domain S-box-containing protein
MPYGEIALFLLLALLANLATVGLHALRGRITLGPTFAVAGTLALLLWQLLQLGWWIKWGSFLVPPTLVAIIPPLIAGAVLCYALDGLRTARAYLLVVLVAALTGWGYAVFRDALAAHLPITYAISYSARSHFAMLLSLLGGGAIAIVAFELARRLATPAAVPVAVVIGALAETMLRSTVEYGFEVGWINVGQEAAAMLLGAGFTAVPAGIYWLHALHRRVEMPVRPLAELLAVWRGNEASLHEARESIVSAQRVIQELRQLNASLEESERVRLHQMMESPMPMANTDAAGNVIQANAAAAELFGLPAAALVGESMTALMARVGVSGFRCNSAQGGDARLVVADCGGSERWLEIAAMPLTDSRRQRAGYGLSFKDVTGRELSFRRQRIEEKMRGIHETGRVITHDFSNLLVGVRSNLPVIGAALERGDLAEARRLLDLVDKGMEHGGELIGQLGAGQAFSQPKLRPVAIDALLDEAVGLCAPLARSKGVRLSVAWAGGDVLVEVDATQIVRVFNNLINNAVRATPAGGTIRIAGQADAAGVTIEITDSGVGMSESQVLQAFDPGFTTKAGGKGGLGLAISYLIVDAHGGTIKLERQEVGMRASVWLPRTSVAPLADIKLQGVGVMVWTRGEARALRLVGTLEAAGAKAAEIASFEELCALRDEAPEAAEVLVADAALLDSLALPAGLAVVVLGQDGSARPYEAATNHQRELAQAVTAVVGAAVPTA